MNEDPLQSLLKQADASIAPPTLAADGLADRVRFAARQRHTRRCAASVVGLVLLIVGGFALVDGRDAPQETRIAVDGVRPVPSPETVHGETKKLSAESLRTELARLDARADLHESLAQLMVDRAKPAQAQATVTLASRSTGVRPELRAAQEAEVAAQLMLMRADRLMGDRARSADALVAYRRTIDLFPFTAAADAARQRLGALNLSSGDRI